MLFPHWGMGYGGVGGGFGGIVARSSSGCCCSGSAGWHTAALPGLFTGGGFAVDGLDGDSGGLGGGSMLYGWRRNVHGRGYGGAAAPAQIAAPLAIAEADYQAFETILKHVQADWTKADLSEMRHYATPEMLSYFAEQLAENESQGVRNIVEQVELVRGDPREAWDEGRLHYATCYLRWRAIDYTIRADRKPGDPDAVVSGDPRNPTEAAELWTFVRSPGGLWLLSAVQQV